MGDKARTPNGKSKEKAPKPSKGGLRPHEQREKDAASKSATAPARPPLEPKPKA